MCITGCVLRWAVITARQFVTYDIQRQWGIYFVCWWDSHHTEFMLVLCEHLIFRMESNSYFSIRFDSKRAQLTNTYHHRFLTYLTEWRRFFTLTTTHNNQQNLLLLTMVQVLYLLDVFTLARYGPPSTETPLTETTIVQCHKNGWIYLTSTYYWWLLRPTITIPIRFKMKKLFAQH